MRSVGTLLALCILNSAQAANVWDGGANDGLWATASNWDNNLVPIGGTQPVFPASAPNKEVDLGIERFHERVVLQGGYRLFNGRLVVFGGGSNAEIESTGNNTLDAGYGTEAFGNSVKLIQNAGGTLTVNGNSTGFQKGIELRAHGTMIVNGIVAPGASETFYKTGTGIARLTGSASIQGASGGRFVTAGTLLLNGTATNVAPWTVDGGRLGGTGTVNSSVTAGATRSSVLTPGDPATANGIGTLNVVGDVALAENATLEVQLGSPGSGDRLALSGALAIGARTGLWVRVTPGATPSGSYTIVTHGGSRIGQFVLLDAPPGTTVDYSTPGEVRVVVGTPPAADNIIYPAGSGILDVTQPPYNAIPNDGLDDTVAIQTALDAFPNGRRIIYLPNGTYNVSTTLNWPAGNPGSSDYKHTIMEGQSRDGVILRLPDNAVGYQTPASRKAVIFTGPAPAQRFGIAIRNLTVHTGSGNPGASGVQFNANNFGCIRKVKIVSGDGQGVYGLDMAFTAEIGPLLVQDVEVEGFDYGVQTADAINGIVLERIRVSGQRVAGVRNDGQVFSVRDFTSVNSVPAFINGQNPFGGIETGGAATLLGARFIGLPGAEAQNAIQTAGFLYARDVITTGYGSVLNRITINGGIVNSAASLNEYTTQAVQSQQPSLARSLQLPIEDPPTIPWDAPSEWANVRDFGAVGNGSTNDTAAVQAAIDSGKTTVYFPPNYFFIINGDVLLRSNVRRLTGTQSNVGGSGRIILTDGTAPAVVVERSGYPAIVQQSARTLIVSSVEATSVISTSSGKLFIEDVVSDRFNFQNPRARIWARQLNTENGNVTNVTNNGATLWILGMKTERGQTKLETLNGGFTELLGLHNYSTEDPGTVPLFTVVDSSASFACVAESNFNSLPYINIVSETRGATTTVLPATALPFRTSANGRVLTLYTGFTGAPKRPLDLAISASSPTSVSLTWNDQAWDETGYQIERSTDQENWTTLVTTAANATTFNDNTATPGTAFSYRLRAVNATATSTSTANVNLTTLTLFQSWLQSYNLATTTDPALDTDHDGLGLLLEYALGGAPNTSDTALLPTPILDGGILSYTYNRSRSELTYLVQRSTDLTSAPWTAIGVTQGTPDATVTATTPDDSSRVFLRLRITGP